MYVRLAFHFYVLILSQLASSHITGRKFWVGVGLTIELQSPFIEIQI